MTKPTSTTTKNLALAFEVIRQVIAEPELADEVDELAAEGTILLYDESDAYLVHANDQIAAAYAQRSEPLVRVEIQHRVSFVHR